MARNVLVTGADGQLGSELRALAGGFEDRFFFTDRLKLDITDEAAIRNYVEKNGIDTIINAAAYTAVDRAEKEKSLAEQVNHFAVKYLSQVARDRSIQLIHVSTDYVFDGRNHRPYVEEDVTAPTGVYGRTKLAGEEAMREIGPADSVIVRTSWVYSSYGNNFVKTMLRLGEERASFGVVFDQVGTPTYAGDLAKTILEILPKIKNDKVEIYHYSNEGVLSWYDFAKEIMEMGGLSCNVNPIETKEYPTLASRPHYSVMNKSKIKSRFGVTIPYWKDSLAECLQTLKAKHV